MFFERPRRKGKEAIGKVQRDGEVYWDDFEVEHIKSPVISSRDYFPFGLTFNSYNRENAVPNQYQYNGKELQDELSLGWLDYGARMYMSDIGRWGVIDPMSSKRSGLSPYNYVQNNPLLRVDPTGKLDVTLGGLDKEKTLDQINSGVKGITEQKDDNGKLSYTKTEGAKTNKAANRLIKAIDDHSVNVTINTTNNTTNSKGGVLIGGAFMGTKVGSDGKVTSTYEYDTRTGGRIDDAFKKPGGTVLHEITEGYAAAKMSRKSGESSGPDGTPGSVYTDAHNAALKQPGGDGSVTQTLYDNKGNVLPEGTSVNEVHAAYWKARNGDLIYGVIKQ